eukprot:159142-Pleurochrysis_carterae.AAC.1
MYLARARPLRSGFSVSRAHGRRHRPRAPGRRPPAGATSPRACARFRDPVLVSKIPKESEKKKARQQRRAWLTESVFKIYPTRAQPLSGGI